MKMDVAAGMMPRIRERKETVRFMDKIDALLETLRGEFRQGLYSPGTRFPSQYELSLRFGVNPKTANKAVSLLVAEGLLERQRRGQGTRVRPFRQSYRRSPVVYLGPLNSEYPVRALDGIQSRARREDLFVVYCSPPPEELPETLERFEASGVLGIITNGYGRIRVEHLPVVYFDPPCEIPESHFVTGDNLQGGRDIAAAFLDRGHRDIVALFAESTSRERERGVLEALREAGIPDAESRVYRALDYSVYETGRFLARVKREFPDHTAVIAGTDGLALNVHRLLPEISPEKVGRIGLSGFGNLSAVNSLIPMATVDQHPFQMGVAAVEMLLAICSGSAEAAGGRGEGGFLSEHIPMEVLRADNIPVLRG